MLPIPIMARKAFAIVALMLLGVLCDESAKNDTNLKVHVNHQGQLIQHSPLEGDIVPTSQPTIHKPGVPSREQYDPPATSTKKPSPSKPSKPSKPSSSQHPFDALNWFGTIFGHSAAAQVNSINGTKLPDYVYEAEFHRTTVRPPNFASNPAVQNDVDTIAVSGGEDISESAVPVFVTTETQSTTDESLDNTTEISAQTRYPPPQSSSLFFNNNNNRPNTTLGSEGNGTEPNKGIIDWVLNLVGIQNNKPEQGGINPTIIEPAKNCPKCACGESFKHTRIVGGVETQVNAYPWMTILSYNGRFYCGATVINNKYLLTATHCVNGFAKERLEATFLDHDRSTPFETATFTRKISAVLKHRGYNTGGAYNNDISLLKLSEELPMNGLLKPVCLPLIGKSYTGYTGIATGWGATESHGGVSNKLREVAVPIMSNIDCRQSGYGSRITDNMLCAGYKHGTKDSCQGDSGGPLHVVNLSSHTIVGIVSWGEGCAEPDYPGVYTRVNRYISWIKSNTRDACYCDPV